MSKKSTLVFVLKNEKILLGMKKRGFGKGKWNGFGGKVEKDETIEQTAIREMQEESGLRVFDLQKIGILDFEFIDEPSWNQQVHFFITQKYQGCLKESEEMLPDWFDFSQIPLAEMWPDDEFWMPLLLAGKKFRGKFLFGKNNLILKYEISQTDEL